MQALVDGESLCKELAKAGEEEEAVEAGLEEVAFFCLRWKHERLGVEFVTFHISPRTACLEVYVHVFGYVCSEGCGVGPLLRLALACPALSYS